MKRTPQQRAVYRMANLAKIKEQDARYRARHPERVMASRRACKSSKETDCLRHARYYLKNKEGCQRRDERYRKANPEVISAQRHRRRARVAGATVSNTGAIKAWEAKWRKRSRARCYWCRKTGPSATYHIDHIEALANGGTHSVENLCVSCAPCNLRKGAKHLEDWNAKLSEPILALWGTDAANFDAVPEPAINMRIKQQYL